MGFFVDFFLVTGFFLDAVFFLVVDFFLDCAGTVLVTVFFLDDVLLGFFLDFDSDGVLTGFLAVSVLAVSAFFSAGSETSWRMHISAPSPIRVPSL